MKNIAGLLQELKYTVIDGKPEGEISELVYDSRKVTKDCMFVCIKGAAYDSHDHTEEIARAGAKVIVAERPGEGTGRRDFSIGGGQPLCAFHAVRSVF